MFSIREEFEQLCNIKKCIFLLRPPFEKEVNVLIELYEEFSFINVL